MDLEMGAVQRSADLIEVLLEAVPNHESGHLIYSAALAKLGRTEEAQEAKDRHDQIRANRPGAQASGTGLPSDGG
jgi:hypothetical protein